MRSLKISLVSYYLTISCIISLANLLSTDTSLPISIGTVVKLRALEDTHGGVVLARVCGIERKGMKGDVEMDQWISSTSSLRYKVKELYQNAFPTPCRTASGLLWLQCKEKESFRREDNKKMMMMPNWGIKQTLHPIEVILIYC